MTFLPDNKRFRKHARPRMAQNGCGKSEVAYAPTDVKRHDDLSNLVKLACERYGNPKTIARPG